MVSSFLLEKAPDASSRCSPRYPSGRLDLLYSQRIDSSSHAFTANSQPASSVLRECARDRSVRYLSVGCEVAVPAVNSTPPTSAFTERSVASSSRPGATPEPTLPSATVPHCQN